MLYAAHRRLAAAPDGTRGHARAAAAFEAALDEIDAHRRIQGARPDLLHPAAAKVLATLDREWDGLAAHRDFPDLPLDNNTAERAIRTPVVGRKNYNGSGATWAAELAGHAWTILGTARIAGHNPRAYLDAYLHACAANGGKPPAGQALERPAALEHHHPRPGRRPEGPAPMTQPVHRPAPRPAPSTAAGPSPPPSLRSSAGSRKACPAAGRSPTPSATPSAGAAPTAAAKT